MQGLALSPVGSAGNRCHLCTASTRHQARYLSQSHRPMLAPQGTCRRQLGSMRLREVKWRPKVWHGVQSCVASEPRSLRDRDRVGPGDNSQCSRATSEPPQLEGSPTLTSLEPVLGEDCPLPVVSTELASKDSPATFQNRLPGGRAEFTANN